MKKETKLFTEKIIKDIFSDKPVGNYDDGTPEDALYGVMCDILETDNPTANHINSPAMYGFYSVVVEQIGSVISENIQIEFPFAEYHNLGWGDSKTFQVSNPANLKVQISSKGNGDALVQKIAGDVVTVDTKALKVKAEIPFMKWISGRMNISQFKAKIERAMIQEIKESVYKLFFETQAFGGNSNFNVSNTGGIDSEKLYDLIDLVSGANGGINVVTVASKKFLRGLVGTKTLSDAELEEINKKGYLEMADGNMFFGMDKIYDDDFNAVFDDNTAVVIPVGDDKPVKIVEEGETLFFENTNTNGNMSKEITVYKQVGTAFATGFYTGRYTFTS